MLLIIVAWLFACAMISLMGGWHRLAAKFRSDSAINGEEIRFASMTIGTGLFPARYRRVLFVTVEPTGVGLSVIFPYRLLHPPLFIPWSAVESAQRERSWLVNHVAVNIRGFEKRLFFRGAAGKKILEAFNANAGVT
ncbi:hypothetical protein [Sulfuricaulis sp.]|uniref:hypothetical protein n=1 Tax=Sulfuricaulis sp. TaxID=2003553 RepID=UPI0025D46CA3|nr:hypothetical protein [Sulfuricaulis sp.]